MITLKYLLNKELEDSDNLPIPVVLINSDDHRISCRTRLVVKKVKTYKYMKNHQLNGYVTRLVLHFMRIVFFLFCVGVIHSYSLSSYAQSTRLTIHENSIELEDLFKMIENETDFYFFYNDDKIDKRLKVKADVEDETITELLNLVLDGTNISYQIENKAIILNLDIPSGTQQSKKKISGLITDKSGEPIIGASIMIVGTTRGIVTDIDGLFELEVAPGDELEFTYIGYTTQRLKITNQTNLNIVLKEDTILVDEIVVVGYGVQKKETLTGSIVALKGDDVMKSPALNVSNSLIGKLPGVIINNRSGQPGNDDPSILIRGRSTTGDTSPLIIIDGVERGGLGQLNPNDIESISVLKDASAAIYGARAANGVILVTTKRGTTEKPQICFSFNQGFNQPTRNPKMADSYTFASVYNEIELAGGREARYTPEELQKFKDGSDPNYPNTDWYETVVKDFTPQHQMNVSVNGMGEKVKYYLSFGETYQDGPFNKSSMSSKQYNVRSNIDVKVTDWLDLGVNLAGRTNKNHYPYHDGDIFPHIYLSLPIWTTYWPGTDYLRPNRDSENIFNRVSDAAGTKIKRTKVFQSSFTFDLKIPKIEGLTASGNFSYDASFFDQKDMNTPSYVYFMDEETGEYKRGLSGSSPTNAKLDQRKDESSFTYLNLKLNYLKSFGNHSLGALVGYEQSTSRSNYLSAGRSDFLSTAIPQIFAGSSDKSKQSNDGNAGLGARQNVYGRFNYDFMSKYMLEFTFRVDGSPNFPEGKRYGFFPSVLAGWRISEEKFMKGIEFIDNLKLRASYGRMGNDIVKAYQYLALYGYGDNYVIGNNDVSGLIQSGVPNPNITWEVANTYNVGIDARLLNGLLGVELDLFKTDRSNILTSRKASIPSYTGLTLPDENIGKMNNKGFELTLTHQQAKNDFRYFLSGSMSFARNKVVFMDEEPGAELYQLQTGKPIGSKLYYRALGIFSTEEEIKDYPHLLNAQPGDVKYEDVNTDGVIDSRDMVRINQTDEPEIVYSLSANFEYKNFDLSLLFQGQARAKTSFNSSTHFFRSMSHSFGNFVAWRANDRWTPDNIHASMPRGDISTTHSNTYDSSLWLLDAGFLRLKNVELGYALPQNICNKIGIQNVRFYVSGFNLLIIYDHMKDLGMDPETNQFWYYPPQKTYNIGASITF